MPGIRNTSASDAVSQAPRLREDDAPAGSAERQQAAATPFHLWLARTGGILVLIGIVATALEVRRLDLRAMTDLGLASVFPLQLWAGTVCVAAGSVLALVSRRRPYILLALAATVLVLPGLAVFAEPNMRFVVSWRHVGVIEHLAGAGSIDPGIDAYFSWPGFFGFFAFLQEAAGLSDVAAIAQYAPVVLNALYLVPLYVIGRATTDDETTTWVGLWLFASLNWIGQDYFSPQALYLFVYLLVVAVLVTCFQGTSPRLGRLRRRPHGRHDAPLRPRVDVRSNERTTEGQRAALVGLLALLVVATVASHQLTPFALFLTMGMLVVLRLSYLRMLPVLVALVTGGWIAVAAATYVDGHAGDVFGGLASVLDSLGQNVGDRIQGSPGHELIVRLRLLTTLLLWSLAAWGLWRRRQAGSDVRWAVVPAAAPFLLLALQSYGGEVLLRAALFAAPFMCLLAASVFVQPADGRFLRRGAALLALVGVLVFVVFPFVRWGNERADWYSDDEVRAVDELYAIAPDGSKITAVADALPWRGQAYADHDYQLLTLYGPIAEEDIAREGLPGDETVSVDLDARDPDLLLAQVRSRMAAEPGQCSFLIVSRAQEAYMEQAGPFSGESVPRLERLLGSSSDFDTVIDNRDARVYSLGECAEAAR